MHSESIENSMYFPNIRLTKRLIKTFQIHIDDLPSDIRNNWIGLLNSRLKKLVISRNFIGEATTWFKGGYVISNTNNSRDWAETVGCIGLSNNLQKELVNQLRKEWKRVVSYSSEVQIDPNEGWTILSHIVNQNVLIQIDRTSWIKI